jgi:hypothetical protein
MTISTSSLSKSTLSKLLTSPSKLAHAIDWHQIAGSVLTLNILSDRIELAVAPHPAYMEETIQSLPSIPVKTSTANNQRVLSPALAQELKSLIDSWQVCGLVVNWPVQPEGWCGAQCGRVLFTLDQLARDIDRPICLWDQAHTHVDEDEWGRNPVYARVPAAGKEVHIASKEQYHAPNVALVEIWNDFCRSHWPELYYNVRGVSTPSMSRKESSSDSMWLESATF